METQSTTTKEEETEVIRLSPLVAAIQGRDEDEQFILSSMFLALDEHAQDVLAGESTPNLIHQWVAEGLLPETHMLAIAKIIGLVALAEEVSVEALPSLLEKINIPSDHATTLAQRIADLVQPILAEPAEEPSEAPVVTAMEPLPALTRPSQNGPRPVQSPPKRNIIDLRTNQPQS